MGLFLVLFWLAAAARAVASLLFPVRRIQFPVKGE